MAVRLSQEDVGSGLLAQLIEEDAVKAEEVVDLVTVEDQAQVKVVYRAAISVHGRSLLLHVVRRRLTVLLLLEVMRRHVHVGRHLLLLRVRVGRHHGHVSNEDLLIEQTKIDGKHQSVRDRDSGREERIKKGGCFLVWVWTGSGVEVGKI